MIPTSVDAIGRAFLMGEEGSRAKRYRDAAGFWTIGIGHKMHDAELASGFLDLGDERVPWLVGLSPAQIATLLDQDLAWAIRDLQHGVKVPLTQNQFNALVSFTFNVGPKWLVNPQGGMQRAVNGEHVDVVPHEMARWIYSGTPPRIDPILVARRQREGVLWRQR